jgi:quercetin dioxygenase-like cupin family protein
MQISPSVAAPAALTLAPGEGRALWVAGFRHTIKVTGAQTGGAFALVEVEVPPGGGPPPHVHSREAETFLVLEGAFEFVSDGEAFEGAVGATVSLPAGSAHSFRCLGPDPGRLAVLITPAGFEGYFEDLGVPAHDGAEAPTVDEAAVAAMLAAAPAYGLTFVGGPPA